MKKWIIIKIKGKKYVAQKEYKPLYKIKKELFKSFATQTDTSTVLNFMN